MCAAQVLFAAKPACVLQVVERVRMRGFDGVWGMKIRHLRAVRSLLDEGAAPRGSVLLGWRAYLWMWAWTQCLTTLRQGFAAEVNKSGELAQACSQSTTCV